MFMWKSLCIVIFLNFFFFSSNDLGWNVNVNFNVLRRLYEQYRKQNKRQHYLKNANIVGMRLFERRVRVRSDIVVTIAIVWCLMNVILLDFNTFVHNNSTFWQNLF